MTPEQAKKYAEKWLRGKQVYEQRYGSLENAMRLEGFTEQDIEMVKNILKELGNTQ